MPLCLECNRQVKMINYQHLKSCSGLSISSYEDKHPGSPLWDIGVKESCAKPGKLNGRWKEGKKRFCVKCGRKLCRHNKTGFCNACFKFSGKPNPFLGRRHSTESLKQMRESSRKRERSTFYKIPTTREIIDKREKTRAENWSKLTIEERHKRLEIFIKSGRRKTGTKIEERVNEILVSFGMIEGKNYRRNVQIGGYNVDFLADGKYIIDCYGDYWHRNPKYYKDISAETKNQKDLDRQIYLEDKGFNFIYFWEEDIKKHPENIMSAIKDFFGQYYNLFEWESCCEYQNV